MRKRGFNPDGECILVEGLPVQLLPAYYDPLLEEALAAARETRYGNTMTRVLRPEHLAAIMLQTGRDKDRQRFSVFMKEAPLDMGFLREVLARHKLTERFDTWNKTA
jgi:hypothetical protein